TAIWTIVSFVGLVGIEFYGGTLLIRWAGEPLLTSITISFLFASICMGFTIAGGLRGVSAANTILDAATVVSTCLLFWYLYKVHALGTLQVVTLPGVSVPSIADNVV